MKIAIGVTECGDRTATDMLPYADGLILFVIDKADFRLPDNNGFAVGDFLVSLDTAADHLLRWDSVNPLGPRPHEFNAAAGDDPCLKSIRL